jgi:hypothetical protein
VGIYLQLCLASNTETKIYDAEGKVVLEQSTDEVRNWKENLATESEADVCLPCVPMLYSLSYVFCLSAFNASVCIVFTPRGFSDLPFLILEFEKYNCL